MSFQLCYGSFFTGRLGSILKNPISLALVMLERLSFLQGKDYSDTDPVLSKYQENFWLRKQINHDILIWSRGPSQKIKLTLANVIWVFPER